MPKVEGKRTTTAEVVTHATEQVARDLREALEIATATVTERLDKLGEIRAALDGVAAEVRGWMGRAAEMAERLGGVVGQDLTVLASRLRDVEAIIGPVEALLKQVPTSEAVGAAVAQALAPVLEHLQALDTGSGKLAAEVCNLAAAEEQHHAAQLGALRSADQAAAARHAALATHLAEDASLAARRHEELIKTVQRAGAAGSAGTEELVIGVQQVREAVAVLARDRGAERRSIAGALAGVEFRQVGPVRRVSAEPARFPVASVRVGPGVHVEAMGNGSLRIFIQGHGVRRWGETWYPAEFAELADRAAAAAGSVLRAQASHSVTPRPRLAGPGPARSTCTMRPQHGSPLTKSV